MKYLKTVSIEERGILTSAYKQEIKKNMRIEKSKSISKIKSMILNHEGKIESQTGVILQVSLFALAIILITF
ncbi:hypothetical protein [Polaribacter glomeratus]|uniref:Uncharacterized protein n=1 Tax=Polaribacter glomeratus TaxID=102 RepID=A0A2S7WIH2_9FLAO|nr:hypothetical protein [Polaribacter glomeratus]PQJ77405.1 hypothetical protein BTO16_16375 [Polaribacter glomeratus]TXD65990.1 hypothetical protein ESX12_07470 [Polaribacter glomeratus]